MGRGGDVEESNSEHNLMLRFDNRFPTLKPPCKKKFTQGDIYIDIAITRQNWPSAADSVKKIISHQIVIWKTDYER